MAADGHRHVLAIGGLAPNLGTARIPPLFDHAISLTGRSAPRVCILPTANEPDLRWVLEAHRLLAGTAAVSSHLTLFPQPNVSDPTDLLLSQDLILVGGGSVANMVAVWRVHGLDAILRTAWEQGVVLAGVSAGAICWFESGTTDSFGPELRPFRDGLGLVRGSYCPHYRFEPGRRPAYQAMVAEGSLPPGLACDDGAAFHFVDDELAEVVAEEAGAVGYRVSQDGRGGCLEAALPARLLAAPGQAARS
ncbi:MAG: Type 1 glutamine amidotransferase-like domain-containing protein [Candidatus Dormibacteria bacterium]